MCPLLSGSVSKITSINGFGLTTINSINDIPSSIEPMSFNVESEVSLEIVNCRRNQCEWWDSNLIGPTGSRGCCAIHSGDFQRFMKTMVGTETEKEEAGGSLINIIKIFDLMKNVIGTESEAKSKDLTIITSIFELIEYFKSMIGEETDKRLPNGEVKNIIQLLQNPFLEKYLKAVLGKEEDRDEEMSLIKYLVEIIGKKEEKTDEMSLIKYIPEILGKPEDRDDDMSLVKYFTEILGKKDVRDEELTLIEFLKVMIGEKKHLVLPLLEYINHIHNQHLHYMGHDYDEFDAKLFGEDGGFGRTPKYAILINEFMGSEDLDGNGLIYGYDFMITDSPTKPKPLITLEEHPMWDEPTTEMTWEDYLSSFE